MENSTFIQILRKISPFYLNSCYLIAVWGEMIVNQSSPAYIFSIRRKLDAILIELNIPLGEWDSPIVNETDLNDFINLLSFYSPYKFLKLFLEAKTNNKEIISQVPKKLLDEYIREIQDSVFYEGEKD